MPINTKKLFYRNGKNFLKKSLINLNISVTVARNVKLANGGSDVYALGTNIALGEVLPSQANATSAFRYGENGAIVKKGYLPAYKDVPLVELGNALVPNTINGTPQTIVSDKIIYMVPMGMYRPVKVVFEGTTLTVEKHPTEQADHTYVMNVNMFLCSLAQE